MIHRFGRIASHHFTRPASFRDILSDSACAATHLPPIRQITTQTAMSSTQSSALASALSSNSDTTFTTRTFSEPITTAINSDASSEVLEEKLSSSWRVLIDTAAKTDHQSQKPLAEIAKAIQQQRVGDDEKSKTVTIWGSQVKLWEDMPLLGASMRSAWNRGMSNPTLPKTVQAMLILSSPKFRQQRRLFRF